MSEQPLWPDVLWREKTLDRLRLGLRLPETLVWFEGHFPGCPILPGVVQVHWAAGLFLQEYGPALTFRHMEAIKFRRLLLPDMEVMLDLAYDPGRLRLVFHYSSGPSEYSSGRLYWAAP